MQMTEGEMYKSWREARFPDEQIVILSHLNNCSVDVVRKRINNFALKLAARDEEYRRLRGDVCKIVEIGGGATRTKPEIKKKHRNTRRCTNSKYAKLPWGKYRDTIITMAKNGSTLVGIRNEIKKDDQFSRISDASLNYRIRLVLNEENLVTSSSKVKPEFDWKSFEDDIREMALRCYSPDEIVAELCDDAAVANLDKKFIMNNVRKILRKYGLYERVFLKGKKRNPSLGDNRYQTDGDL